MYTSISFSVKQKNISKKIFKVFSNKSGDLFISLHYFKAEEYNCGHAVFSPGVATIQLNPIIEGKKSPIPIKYSYHQDGQVQFKPIDSTAINVKMFYKFAEVKCTPFNDIIAQHIFTVEFEGLNKFSDFKTKDKDEIYGIFEVPGDAIRFKMLGYLGKTDEDILNLVPDAKTFSIDRKGIPSRLFLGIHFIPYQESLDESKLNKPMFYFLCGFKPEDLNHNNSSSLLYLFAK
jgi:hypothetical protein